MNQQLSPLKKHLARTPLYTRFGFMLLVVFAMLGNCRSTFTGGSLMPSIVMMGIIAVAWVGLRILSEGTEAYMLLRLIKAHETEEKKASEKKDDPPAA